MSTITRYSKGSGSGLAIGDNTMQIYQTVIDAAKCYEDGGTASDVYQLFVVPANTLLIVGDAQITSTLANVTSVDIGTTVGDPDEYVDAQTDTAVGRFTAYVASTPFSTGAAYKQVVTSETKLYLKWGALGATSAGKVSVTIGLIDLDAKEIARPHVYTN